MLDRPIYMQIGAIGQPHGLLTDGWPEAAAQAFGVTAAASSYPSTDGHPAVAEGQLKDLEALYSLTAASRCPSSHER